MGFAAALLGHGAALDLFGQAAPRARPVSRETALSGGAAGGSGAARDAERPWSCASRSRSRASRSASAWRQRRRCAESSVWSCAFSSSSTLRRRMSARLDAPTRWESMWTSPNARITRRLLLHGCVSSAQYAAGDGARGERGLPLRFERALVSCRCEALDGSGVAPVQRLVQQFARPIAALGEPDAEAVQIVIRRGRDVEPLRRARSGARSPAARPG